MKELVFAVIVTAIILKLSVWFFTLPVVKVHAVTGECLEVDNPAFTCDTLPEKYLTYRGL